MQNAEIKRLAIASVPLLSLFIMMLMFNHAIKVYVRCEGENCKAVDQKRVLLADDPKLRELLPGEPVESVRRKELKSAERTAAIYSGRLTFLFLFNTYFLVCLIAAVIAALVIYKSLAESGHKPTRWLLIAIGSATAAGLWLWYKPEPYLTIFRPLFLQTISQDLTNIEGMMVRVNSFGFAVTLFLALAICCILYTGKASSKSDGLKQLSLRMKYLQLVLYVGTVMLVVGVLLIRSVYRWSQAFILREEPALKAAETFFSGLLAAEGGHFTLVLAMLYLPAAFILRSRAESLSGLPETEPEKETVLKNYNLAFSLSQSLPRLAAILGPVLVGPIGEMFSRLQ